MRARITTVFALGLLSTTVHPVQAELEWFGFVESGIGVRTAEIEFPSFGAEPENAMLGVRPPSEDFVLRETRVQLRAGHYGDGTEARIGVDFLYDEVTETEEIELREGYLRFNVGSELEVRAGRQPTTWGTGDLLFINDLFPKDYVSFFTGRDDEYLKYPSDAIRFGLFALPVDLDLVYTPRFTPDRVPAGERLVIFLPGLIQLEEPNASLENGELALRVHRYFGSWTTSVYGYRGFWKSPVGIAGRTTIQVAGPGGFEVIGIARADYPRLDVYGASVRGPLGGGVFWMEGGYYHSKRFEDRGEPPAGDGPSPRAFAPGSEVRGLVGFERKLAADFTAGVQLYGEFFVDPDEVEVRAAHAGLLVRDDPRSLVTVRLTQDLLYQTLQLSLFAFGSPSDEDVYVRARASYDLTDEVALVLGGNVFEGDSRRTLFGGNDLNDNVYVRARYSF